MTTIYTIPAKRDLVGIWVYIAEDNIDAADAMEMRIHQVCAKLDNSPAMGKLRPELGAEIRTFGVGNYVIYCRSTPKGPEYFELPTLRETRSVCLGNVIADLTVAISGA